MGKKETMGPMSNSRGCIKEIDDVRDPIIWNNNTENEQVHKEVQLPQSLEKYLMVVKLVQGSYKNIS